MSSVLTAPISIVCGMLAAPISTVSAKGHCALLVGLLLFAAFGNCSLIEPLGVFTSGHEGYACYRIPAIVSPRPNHLMLVVEARRHDCEDKGAIDLVQRRSTDGGATWLPVELLYGESRHPGAAAAAAVKKARWNVLYNKTHLHRGVTIGNPNLVVCANGDLLLVACREYHEMISFRSVDGGASWTGPASIDIQLEARWMAPGPAAAIRMASGDLLVCAYAERQAVEGMKLWGAFVIRSTDNGFTWKRAPGFAPAGFECTLAELPTGELVMNGRSATANKRRFKRQFSWSSDVGDSWSYPITAPLDWTIGNHGASMLQASSNQLLFTTPFDAEEKGGRGGRTNGTVFSSVDLAKSWQVERRLESGFGRGFGYSTMTRLNATHVAIAWEAHWYKNTPNASKDNQIVIDVIRISAEGATRQDL